MFKLKSKKLILGILLCLCTALFACGIFAFSNTAISAHAATPITPTIYWGVQGNTLVFDNKSVSGSPSGNFPGNTTYPIDYITAVCNDTTVSKSITNVDILDTVAPVSTTCWFLNLSNLKNINNLSNLDMSNSTDMSCMFQNCSSLESLDLSCWDTSKVGYFNLMFSGCSKLTEINVLDWVTPEAYNFNSMFLGCSSLTDIDISGWTTQNAKYFQNMFKGCGKLRYVDFSNFDLSNMLNISNMFDGTTGLEVIKLSSANVTFLKNEAAKGGDNVKLPFPLFDQQGNKYDNVSSLPDNNVMFFTSVKHTHTTKSAGTVTSPTCTDQGYTTKICDYCDETFITDYVKANGHSFINYVPDGDATCTLNGHETAKCDNCSETHTRDMNKLGHNFVAGTVTTPTCTAQGYTTYVCSRCAETEQRDIVKALDHDFVAGAVTAPTCVDQGYTTFNCSRCTATKQGAYVNANGHSFTNYVSDVNVTCTADGTQTATCDNCTVTDKIALPALGHDYQTISGNPPTCTTGGSGTEECSRCHDIKVTQNAPALGHTEVVDKAKDPNCTETGLTEGKHCSRCNEVLTAQTEIPVLGHNWTTDWDTDTTNHWHECTVCGEKKDDEAHIYDWVITKEPTVDEEGEKEEYCTVCDYANGNKETLAKLVVDDNGSVSDLPTGHDYDLEIAVKESDSLYNIPGITKGYKVELFVVDGEDRNHYDSNKQVTLMLVIPEGMEDEFTLYCRYGEILERVDPASYTVNGKSVTIRTTLPNEYVFNAPAPEEPSAGIPWWVWLIVGLVAAALLGIFIIIIVVAKKKKDDDDGTPVDNGEVLSQLAEQGQKIDELLTRSDDGGFNAPVELDENGNVIFK